ncbi:hypothetical protein BJ912DRAFT_1064838 [Pholiota molesta]|nr:hypothetical protein BJ912DRAFT_1064838 [Pholiota molesta]
MSTPSTISVAQFATLYEANLIPLRVVLASLVWVLHDYFVTLEDEIRYIWTQKPSFGRFMFLWVRYYTIFLLGFDTLQIHTFALPGVATHGMCVAADPATRVAGAILLWSIEIIMQMRIYILYNSSKRVLIFNGVLFLGSIGSFLWLVIIGAIRRKWAQWIPATGFEGILFAFALYKAAVSVAAWTRLNQRLSLTAILINENILYFSVVSSLLVFNNLMVVGKTKIPWFGYGPFHAAVGIVTCRMLIHLRKFAVDNFDKGGTNIADTKVTAGGPVFKGSRSDPESHYTDDTELATISQ